MRAPPLQGHQGLQDPRTQSTKEDTEKQGSFTGEDPAKAQGIGESRAQAPDGEGSDDIEDSYTSFYDREGSSESEDSRSATERFWMQRRHWL